MNDKTANAKSNSKSKSCADSKSLEYWIWSAACSIRGAKDAPKYKDYILPLIFTKRLCDVFDDELDRIATAIGSRHKAFRLVKTDHKLVRFYLPLEPSDPDDSVWSVIRKLSTQIGEGVSTHLRDIDRVDFNATTHGQRDIDDDRLSNLIEAISTKRLGLNDVEADIIGKSYEYLIRKFAEGGGQSAGEFYTPGEVGEIMAKVLDPDPGMEIYDPACGSGGLLIKCEIAMEAKMKAAGRNEYTPLKLFGQEYISETWAMANMNMIIHDMEGQIEIGNTFKNPKFRNEKTGKLRAFDRVVANPMWNQDWFSETDYDNDELDRFPAGAGFPGKSSADWGWVQHMHASLNDKGRAAVVLDTGAASRGSGNAGINKEKTVRQWFVDQDLIESVLYLPENLFYNATAPGIVIFLNKSKPKTRQGKVFLVNAGQLFEKGKPKNFIPPDDIQRIADILIAWKEEEKLSRIVDHAELKKNDYNISPSRYIHTGDTETYRPIAEIVGELKAIKAEARETDKALEEILRKIGRNRITGDTGEYRDMRDGKTCAVPDSFVKSRVGRQNQIPAKDIAKVGRFPVIDQGKEFIAGYCDDVTKVIDFDLPLIIFGDHTRCFKYIDFPFVLGADGTKVLLPNKELYDPHFYYFALSALDIPSRGYNRHFKILKERSIPLPPLPEQKKIAHILATIQKKADNAQSKKSKLQDLFRTLLHELMTAKIRVI